MGCGERYVRNRSVPQSVTNYLGFVGSVFFALQNLSTNWGGDFRDDNSLTDAVKAHNLAGTAWDEQYLQVGALLIAWSFYVLGAELQGNMSPGRYKRTMTWMLNIPTLVFFIGNMILSSRRNSDGVQTDGTLAWDITFGILFIILILVNTAIYATSPRYAQEKWLNIVEGEVVDNPREDPIDPKAFSNNRFWLQGLLHLIAVGCLLYFCIVGLANYDNNKGWLLTDLYKADPFVVKVWDIGGASVGMLALPLMLMFVGLELQGDLPPCNYKPLSVFVGAVNIFTSSIFLYATNWDAYDRGVITSHAAPLVIMLILCILAIIVVVCYGVMVPYSDAVWLKVLADPWEVGYGQDKDARPATGYAFGGSGDVEAKPDAQPDPEQGKALGTPPQDDQEDPGGMTAMEDEEVAARRDALRRRGENAGRDPNWIITPRVEEEDLADIIVSWDAPPGTNPEDVEYRVDVTDVESGNIGHETVILPGNRRKYMIDEVAGEPIIPGEHFHIHVQWRYKSDAENADEGWQGYSGETQVATAEQEVPVALLRSRTPRVHLRQPIGFKSNHNEIRKGSEALPALAQLLQENPDMTLGVDGHVNFGQSESAALRLSQARAEEVCDALQELGADRSRLVAAGFGWSRPRFPRTSKFAGRNRRVEFRVLPGSPLYERLRSEAVARRNTVNGPEDQLKTFSTRNLLGAQQPAPAASASMHSMPRPGSVSSMGAGAGLGAGAGANAGRNPTPLPPIADSGKADATSAPEATTASPAQD